MCYQSNMPQGAKIRITAFKLSYATWEHFNGMPQTSRPSRAILNSLLVYIMAPLIDPTATGNRSHVWLRMRNRLLRGISLGECDVPGGAVVCVDVRVHQVYCVDAA